MTYTRRQDFCSTSSFFKLHKSRFLELQRHAIGLWVLALIFQENVVVISWERSQLSIFTGNENEFHENDCPYTPDARRRLPSSTQSNKTGSSTLQCIVATQSNHRYYFRTNLVHPGNAVSPCVFHEHFGEMVHFNTYHLYVFRHWTRFPRFTADNVIITPEKDIRSETHAAYNEYSSLSARENHNTALYYLHLSDTVLFTIYIRVM